MDRPQILFPAFWLPKLKWAAALLVLAAGGYLFLIFNWSYSDGDRVGYLQKLSHKGWLCKTYEGELAMTTVPGVAPVLWTFSVKMWDEPLAQQVNGLLGKRVVRCRSPRQTPTVLRLMIEASIAFAAFPLVVTW